MVATRPVTVILADDSVVFRAGMARAISGHSSLELVADVGDGLDALHAILELQPDVALLDVAMPGLDGPDIVERLRELGCRTRTVLISAQPDDAIQRVAERSGATRAFGKSTSRREVCAALVGLGTLPA